MALGRGSMMVVITDLDVAARAKKDKGAFVGDKCNSNAPL